MTIPYIKFEGKTLYRKDLPGDWQAWLSFGEYIEQTITMPKWGVIVVLEGRQGPRNVFLVGFDGKIRWQIQSAPGNEHYAYHSGRLVVGEHPVFICYSGKYGVEMEDGSVVYLGENL